jgi:hypothetical protein
MPSNIAQADLIREAYARAGLDINNPMDRPQFFHAHGTGTPAGDPQEAEAISRSFFGNGQVHDTLHVGSIKTVIGYVVVVVSLLPCTHWRLLIPAATQTHRGFRRSCQLDRICYGDAARRHAAQPSFQESERPRRPVLHSSQDSHRGNSLASYAPRPATQS